MKYLKNLHTTNNRPIPHNLWGIGMVLLLLFVSCKDTWNSENVSSETDTENFYWHTQTRSRAEQEVMLRNHGVGFSYDAIYGEKCDVGSVRCQVLNLDFLRNKQVYRIDDAGKSKLDKVCSHSFSEYCHNTNITAKASADLPLYKEDYSRAASIFEHALDTCISVTTTQIETACFKFIASSLWEYTLEEEGEECLSDNFLYALDRIRRTDVENTAVVDSFIQIFGTHVITSATIGGKLQLDIVTDRKNVKTFVNEKVLKESSLDVLFKRMESTVNEKDKKYIHGILKNAQLHLSITGGDQSAFGSLVSNLSPDNVMASANNLSQWAISIQLNEENIWDDKCEMVDMTVSPIWEFIPDKITANRVKARIIATAPTMQELYGNRNFLNVVIPSVPQTVTTTLGGKKVSFNSPWVVDVIAANRRVATICKEWVPEIDLNNSVQVIYPIYENRMLMEAGLCIHHDSVYQVKWLYDRFEVIKQDSVAPSGKVYLNFGTLECQGKEGVNYQTGKFIIGYEWPGSILPDGTLAKDKPYYETRKFLGNFFLNTDQKFTDLPNWDYQGESLSNSYYEGFFKKLPANNQELPYRLSGIQLKGRTGKGHLGNRMVRNNNYVYYMNSTELGL